MSKIHFIGIAGVAIAPIAKMMKDLGWYVTGSDEDVFDPIRSFLISNGLEWQEGYDEQRVIDVDIVVVGGGAIMKYPDNPELLMAKKLNKKLVSFPYLLQEYVIKDKSIVVAGTYGKTTTSGLLAWILDYAGLNPSFMTGGQPIHFDTGTRKTDSEYSVLEGDEFAASFGFDNEPKFVYYKPKFTLITAAQWDHLNLYPTEDSFVGAFRKLLDKTIERQGIALLCSTGKNNDVLFEEYSRKLPIHTYALGKDRKCFTGKSHYSAIVLANDADRSRTYFSVYKNDVLMGKFSTLMIGEHNIENCVGAIAMCDILELPMDKVNKAVGMFKGIKRRQEIRGKSKHGAIVIDDLAHSAVKAKATLRAIRTRYPEEKVTVVFDPHASSLSDRKSLEWYPGAFDEADEIIIPKVSVKKSTPKAERVYGMDIVNAIRQTQSNVVYCPIDDMIVDTLDKKDSQCVIVFMSSGGWRGIIEKILA